MEYFDIIYRYNELENDLKRLFTMANHGQDVETDVYMSHAYEDIKEAILKAKMYDLDRLKRSEGGKKSARNMTKKQREERARKAGQTRKKAKA